MDEKNIIEEIEDYLISEMGEFFEFVGSKSIIGQIYGLLITHDDPVSLKKIAEKLHLTKSTVSTNIRSGVQLELFKKVYMKGKPREDFYEMSNDFVDLMTKPGLNKLMLLSGKIKGAREILENSAGKIKDDKDLMKLYKKIIYLDKSFEIFNEEYKKFTERAQARTNLLKEDI